MTTSTSHSTFRRWRRGSAFKQKEIARLLGLKGVAQLSRVEHGKRSPGLAFAIALEVLTGMPLHEIITPLYEAVEEETLARVTAMLMELEGSEQRAAMVKCRQLRGCQDRVITRHRQKMHEQP